MRLLSLLLVLSNFVYSAENCISCPTLQIGSSAPNFNLKGTDMKMYNLDSFSAAKILVIIFTCNHCLAAQRYEERIKQLAADYLPKGVQVVAISPDHPESIRPDELGYTEYGDSFEEMRTRAKEKAFNFPYLYDGETGNTAKKYDPAAIPQLFIFDSKRLLQYSGRIDDVENPLGTPGRKYARDAIDAILSGKAVAVPFTTAVGCPIKWADVIPPKNEAGEWAKEKVSLQNIDEDGIKKLLKNESGKLRLVNFWADWCIPCMSELPELANINRMYSQRNFELVTICVDKPGMSRTALNTLIRLKVATSNYFNEGNLFKTLEVYGLHWGGGLPYNLLIEPGGKIIYERQGGIQSTFMKKKIVDHPLLGR